MKIYIVAGEPSGDLLGSGLMKSISEKTPNVDFYGIGGESMAESGFKSLFDISELSVMGFFEVLPGLPLIMKRLEQTVRNIEFVKPDVIVTIDSWGFVSDLLKRLKRKGVRIPKVHYVAPQVWAWKKGRAKNAAQITDRLMTLLPYEPQYFEKYGLKCDFTGHPVVESAEGIRYDKSDFARKYNIPDDAFVLCVLPGSRKSEASRLIPEFKKSINILSRTYENIFILIPVVQTVAKFVEKSFENSEIPFRTVFGREERYRAFKTCKAAMAASGTVSLELAACGTPHVIAYTFDKVTNFLARLVIKLKFVNLINILADREIIPEFLGKNCKGESIADKIAYLLGNADATEKQINEATAVLKKLKPDDKSPSENAADVVLETAKYVSTDIL